MRSCCGRQLKQHVRCRGCSQKTNIFLSTCVFQVAKGKMLAGKLKELGYAGEWERMLEALEEGPKNAIVCT